jgi:hypothetical protein
MNTFNLPTNTVANGASRGPSQYVKEQRVACRAAALVKADPPARILGEEAKKR